MRIVGVNIPDDKQIRIALTYIYGVGSSLSSEILKQTGIDGTKEVSELTDGERKKVANFIEKNYKIEGDLKREKQKNIRRLKEIESWRGVRHKKGLPVRGQTTRVNSRTVRGNVRRTMGSGRKPAPQAT